MQREARAEVEVLNQLQHALVNSDGQNYHVTVNLDFPPRPSRGWTLDFQP